MLVPIPRNEDVTVSRCTLISYVRFCFMFIDTRVDECTVLILICVHINISLPGKHTDPNPSTHFISRSIIR